MNDCILWTGYTTRSGYGQRRRDGKVGYVHRQEWEEKNGPIPAGMTIDHLCRVKSCMNVEHMEVVTFAENSRRAVEARKADATVCTFGHARTPENTYTVSGRDFCAPCTRNRVAAHRRRKARVTTTP